MPLAVVNDIESFRIGNYVMYRGSDDRYDSRFGIIIKIDNVIVSNEQRKVYLLSFGNETDLVPFSVDDEKVHPIKLGRFTLRRELMEAFNFTYDIPRGVWVSDDLAFDDVKTAYNDERGLLFEYRLSARNVNARLPNAYYNPVKSIHEIQNFSMETLDRDVISKTMPSVIGQKWWRA